RHKANDCSGFRLSWSRARVSKPSSLGLVATGGCGARAASSAARTSGSRVASDGGDATSNRGATAGSALGSNAVPGCNSNSGTRADSALGALATAWARGTLDRSVPNHTPEANAPANAATPTTLTPRGAVVV